jgi:hypothetical protein
LTLAFGEVMAGAALVTSLMVAVVGGLLSYAVRQRDADTERRLVVVDLVATRVAALETGAAVSELDRSHMRDDLAAVRADVAELLRLARGGSRHD